MTMKEVVNLTRGDKLIWHPSGLVVTAWEIDAQGVTVRAPKGGVFTVNLDNLERVEP